MELANILHMALFGWFLCKQSSKADGEIKAPCSYHSFKILFTHKLIINLKTTRAALLLHNI